MKMVATLAAVLFLAAPAMAQEYVNGHYRSNGTYVNGYYRSDRDNTVKNNYSYYGNSNPYTGSTGTNRYSSSPSSDYYGGGSLINGGGSSSSSILGY